MTEPDLSTPSFAAAYTIARRHAASGDPAGAARLFSRLLWHVDASEEGFIGLSDEQLFEKCESDKRLNHAIATAAIYAPGPGPFNEAWAPKQRDFFGASIAGIHQRLVQTRRVRRSKWSIGPFRLASGQTAPHGIHEMVNGQLIFRVPYGAIADDKERRLIQQNLNRAQRKFYRE